MLKKTKNNANNYVKQDNIEKMEKQMFVLVVVVPQNINIMMHMDFLEKQEFLFLENLHLEFFMILIK